MAQRGLSSVKPACAVPFPVGREMSITTGIRKSPALLQLSKSPPWEVAYFVQSIP